jgi:PAS domain S-box-containing protein
MTDSLLSYRLRAIRVGVAATYLAVAILVGFLLIPSGIDIHTAGYIGVLIVATVGVLIVQFAPWRTLFSRGLGMPAMYVWSVLDIVLITLLVIWTGGDESPMFLLFALTTVFFAASYPPRAQLALLVFTLACFLGAIFALEEHIVAAPVFLRFATLTVITYITSFTARELMQQNSALEAEVLERTRTEELLRKREEQLAEAQALAHLGSWDWSIESGELTWSKELYRIFGMEPQNGQITYDAFLSGVHQDDRERVSNLIDGALRDGKPFAFEHRIVRPDGEERTVQAQGRVDMGPNGKPVRMFGTGLDITERKKAEETKREIAELRARRKQAMEINDSVVQGLAVAAYALDAKDDARARKAVRNTLEAVRSMISGLLDHKNIKPGDLVRSEPAEVTGESHDGESTD